MISLLARCIKSGVALPAFLEFLYILRDYFGTRYLVRFNPMLAGRIIVRSLLLECNARR